MAGSGHGIPVSQGFMLMMLTAGLTNHVMIIPVVLEKSGRDAWITVVVGAVLFIPWILFLYSIMKKLGNRTMKTAIEDSGGKGVRRFILGMISVYLFFFALYTLKEVVDWTKSTYLLETPVTVTTIVMLLLCVATAYSGVITIGTSAGILLPVVVALGFFVSFSNAKHKNYDMLLPMLENGITPVFHGLPAVIGGFTQFILALFLRPHLKKNPSLITFAAFHLTLIMLTLGPTMAGISEFGPEEMKTQRYPAYEQWRLVKLGKFIEHVDFLSIFQWLSGAYISISLCMYLISEYIFPASKRLIGIFCSAVLMAGLCISPLSNLRMYHFIGNYILVICAIYTTLLLVLLYYFVRHSEAARSG